MANFFNRLGHIEIIAGEKIIFTTGTQTITANVFAGHHDTMRVMNDIDFKFSCKKICDMSTTSSNAKVSILGLSRETIQFLATYRPIGIERQSQKRIRVYASYEDFGENLIFDGDIVIAKPSCPPENWIDITAYVGNYRNAQLHSTSVNGIVSIDDLLSNVSKELGLELAYIGDKGKEFEQEKSRQIKGFDCSGTRQDLIQSVNRVSNFRIHEEDGCLIAKLDDSKFIGSSHIILSEATGMIGVPEINVGTIDSLGTANRAVMQVTVKSFINPSIKLWDTVDLRSIYLPDVNGVYTVMQIEYNGHLRGQEWYQTMLLTTANTEGVVEA